MIVTVHCGPIYKSALPIIISTLLSLLVDVTALYIAVNHACNTENTLEEH